MKVRVFVGLLVFLAAVRLALMAVVPVFEPSEARYAAISANMARSGDFVVPHFTHNFKYQSFDGKPPLVFQAGGVFCKLFGVNEFAVRLFPFLSAALVLLILYGTVRRFSDAASARLAVLVCASCTAFYVAAGVSMTDMSLACCIAGALLLYRCFLDGFQLRFAVGVAALLGAGMIVKGPISLVLFGLPVFLDALVNRRWRGIFNWKWLAVAPLYLVVAVPWFVLVEQRNPGAVVYYFYNENFLRFVTHDYGDKYGAGREAFRGVSVLWALVVTLPWVLLPVWDGVRRWRGWRGLFATRWSFEALAIAAIVGFWCLTSRVLLYYLFPVIPLFAAWLALRERASVRLTRCVPYGVAISLVVTVGALIGGMFFSEKMQGAKTAFSPRENHYACEFYHGTKSAAELAPYRAAYEAWRKACEVARAAKKESKK